MQINHLQLIRVELSEGQTVREAIDAAAAAGVTTGVAAGLFGVEGEAAAKLGLAAGLMGFVADATTKRIAHTLTTDVLVTEAVPGDGGETEPGKFTGSTSGG